uniref:Uncharacterized protein LOC108042225 isoform X1 n=1 Tax=Drosophila rhopaloa TaxID=1041015 RepID=A0A6P4ECJ9_DRORH
MLTRKSLITLLIMFFLGCQEAADKVLYIPDAKCSDCSNIQSKCTISKSGVYCTNKTDKQNIHFSKGKQEKLLDLAECLPDKFTVTGPILDWCCFWTPKMGCQQLGGTLYQNFSDCDICRHSCNCDEDKVSGMVKISPRRWCAVLGILALLSIAYL